MTEIELCRYCGRVHDEKYECVKCIETDIDYHYKIYHPGNKKMAYINDYGWCGCGNGGSMAMAVAIKHVY